MRIKGQHPFTCRDCEHAFFLRRGRRIVIKAQPRSGWKLIKWGGACKGRSNKCALRLKADKTTAIVTTVPPGDWLNPYRLGTTVTFGGWRVQVLAPVAFNADAVLESAGDPPPPAGTQYTLLHLVMTNVASEKQYLDEYITSSPGMITEGAHKPPNPNGYFPAVGALPPNYLALWYIGSVDPGETVTGYLDYRIESDDASTLKLLLPGLPEPVWLALH